MSSSQQNIDILENQNIVEAISENKSELNNSKYNIEKTIEARIENCKKFKNIDQDKLYDMYINKNMSASEISKELGISQTHMRRLLKKFAFL